MNSLIRCALILPVLSFLAAGQSVVSARSGLVHYLEGRVYLGEEPIESKYGSFPEVKEKAQLRTEEGRAEMLLTPGVVLRLGENSAVRMISNRLIDTRLEFLSGAALIEADDLLKDNAVTIAYKENTVHLLKKGLYRFDGEPATLRIYSGEADIESPGQQHLVVKDGKLVHLDGDMALEKFDNKVTDALYRWSKRRGEYLALANVSAAKSLTGSGSSWQMSGWRWNPYFGMFTFIPLRGYYDSPFGFRFWSPFEVYRVYESPMYWGSYPHSGASSGGSAAPAKPAPPTTISTASTATSAPASSMRGSSSVAAGGSSVSMSRGGSSPSHAGSVRAH